MQRQTTFGGGVSPRGTLPRGQSIIEYVLIAAVIGLVVIFAGPQVSGAIRNQFSQVANTVDSGTGGDSFMSAEEKAYQEAMKNITSKEAKDWTLDEQKAAATDIAKNGTSSIAYAKAEAAMDAGTKFSVKLTNGKTMTYQIIGINHDDLADGSGKAGLTFWFAGEALGKHRMNATSTNAGGWEKSELRAKMNGGEIWNLMPSDFQSKVKVVKKLTNNIGGGYANEDVIISSTSDKLFLPSFSELVKSSTNNYWGSTYPWIYSEGVQYEAFRNGGWTRPTSKEWERSVSPRNSERFFEAEPNGNSASSDSANMQKCIRPAFCF